MGKNLIKTETISNKNNGSSPGYSCHGASFGRPAGTIISSPKGWYDAGDYNKYIVNSGFTLGLIL